MLVAEEALLAGVAECSGPAPEFGRSYPLLKFLADDRPVLAEEGLELIRSLPGPVCPVAFVGDGRSGKSFLASRLIGREDAFETDDSDVAVTSGIDVAVIESHPGHLLVLDCEGGNNAMSSSHSIVTVVGALLGTALTFVTDGKASEAAMQALARMLEERSLIKVDGTGCLHAQTLLFVVNQNRLRYDDDALEKILKSTYGEERREIREMIGDAYPQEKRQFFTLPSDGRKDFDERWTRLHDGIREAAVPLKMGQLWMTGAQVVQMLEKMQSELLRHGKVSLPSLHRHVILDGWLKPKVSQVLASRMDKLLEDFSPEEMKCHKVGAVQGDCQECGAADVDGWQDPDIDDFFCVECWRKFSPKVLKCAFCMGFHPWPRGRVETVTRQWNCVDCLMMMGIQIE